MANTSYPDSILNPHHPFSVWPQPWGRRRALPQMKAYPYGKRNFISSATFQRSLVELASEGRTWSDVVIPLMAALQEAQEEIIGREQEVAELMAEIARRPIP